MVAPEAPFPTNGRTFEDLFVHPSRPKKAWDGQDKDRFFREKYAHVHAKQKKAREEQQAAARERRGIENARPLDGKVLPQPRFAQRHAERLDRDSSLEYIYGTNAVRAVLDTRKVSAIYTSYSYDEVAPDIVARCQELAVPIKTNTPLQHLNIMANQGVHNKYVAATKKRQIKMVESILFAGGKLEFVCSNETHAAALVDPRRRVHPLGVFIDEVTDVHNLGAILRSAYWYGADFVVISQRNCAPLSAQVVKASSGASEYVTIAYSGHPLRFFEQLAEQSWAVVAPSPRPQEQLTSVTPSGLAELIAQRPCMLAVGSEGDGLRKSLLDRSTHCVTLPSAHEAPAVDSLNVSVATAVLLSRLSNIDQYLV